MFITPSHLFKFRLYIVQSLMLLIYHIDIQLNNLTYEFNQITEIAQNRLMHISIF